MGALGDINDEHRSGTRNNSLHKHQLPRCYVTESEALHASVFVSLTPVLCRPCDLILT